MSDPVRVVALSLTAVKGTRLQRVGSVSLTRSGATGDRRFFVIDARDRMVNAKHFGELQAVVADWDEETRELGLVFPDGRRVAGAVSVAPDVVETRFYSRPRAARLVRGPWSAALSEHLGQPLRLVDGGSAVDRGAAGAVSLVSRGSLDRLRAEAEVDTVDSRRFRMLIEVDGIEAHAEDAWVGRSAMIGSEARVRFGGHVGRCLVTSRDPETGVIDLPTLDALGWYRTHLDTTEPLAFGVYGRVEQPGTIRVGDAVTILPAG